MVGETKKAQAVTGAVIARDIADRVRRLGHIIDADLPLDDGGALWDYACRALNSAADQIARAGVALLALKEAAPHGEFQRECEARHIAPRTAQEAMSVARFLLALPHPTQRKLLKRLTPSHLAQLSRIDPESVEELVGGDQLDDLATMSVRELRDEVRKIRARFERADKARAAAQTELREAQTVRRGEAGSEYPEAVVRARMESAALADEATACVHSLLAHFRTLLDSKTDLGARNEKRENLKAGVGAIWVQLCAHAAQVDAALREMDGAVRTEYIPAGHAQMPAPLTAVEQRRVAAEHGRIMRGMTMRAQAREAGRVAGGQLKRGRGRPAAAKVSTPKRPRGRPRTTP